MSGHGAVVLDASLLEWLPRLTLAEIAVFMAASLRGGVTTREAARRDLAVSHPTVRRAVRGLEEHGLVRRLPGRRFGVEKVKKSFSPIEKIFQFQVKKSFTSGVVQIPKKRRDIKERDLDLKKDQDLSTEGSLFSLKKDLSFEGKKDLIRGARSRAPKRAPSAHARTRSRSSRKRPEANPGIPPWVEWKRSVQKLGITPEWKRWLVRELTSLSARWDHDAGVSLGVMLTRAELQNAQANLENHLAANRYLTSAILPSVSFNWFRRDLFSKWERAVTRQSGSRRAIENIERAAQGEVKE